MSPQKAGCDPGQDRPVRITGGSGARRRSLRPDAIIADQPIWDSCEARIDWPRRESLAEGA